MAIEDRRPVIAVLAALGFLLAFPIWISAAVLAAKSTTYCFPYRTWWFLAIGLASLPLSLFGAVSAYRGWRWRLVGYLGLRLVTVITLLIVLGLSWSFTAHGASAWQERMELPKVWLGIERCLLRATVCERGGMYSGCCQRPVFCDGSSSSFSNRDCIIFSSNTTVLCYGCSTCVESVFLAFQSDWRKVNPALLFATLGHGLIFIAEISVYFWVLRQQHAPAPQPPRDLEQLPPVVAT